MPKLNYPLNGNDANEKFEKVSRTNETLLKTFRMTLFTENIVAFK